MPKAQTLHRDSFLAVQTVHIASVQWFWTKDKLHDDDYTSRVQAAVDKELSRVVNQYPTVCQDTRFCCQWEGVQLEGSDLSDVTAAATAIAQVLSRFKGVVPLNL